MSKKLYLREKNPQDNSFTLARKLIDKTTLSSIGLSKLTNLKEDIDLVQNLATFSFEIDLNENITLLIELIYQIAIVYGLDDLNKIPE